jgi:hypothetical protein
VVIGSDKPNETVVDILASMVVIQEQLVVVLMAKHPADDCVVAVAAAEVEVVVETVEVVQPLQHLLAIKAVVVAIWCQLTMQVVLADVEPSLDPADQNNAADHGVHIVKLPNMMARLVSIIKPIKQGKMLINDNKGLNMVPRRTCSP